MGSVKMLGSAASMAVFVTGVVVPAVSSGMMSVASFVLSLEIVPIGYLLSDYAGFKPNDSRFSAGISFSPWTYTCCRNTIQLLSDHLAPPCAGRFFGAFRFCLMITGAIRHHA